MAAHKLVEDDEDGLLYISANVFSNGCAATVDAAIPPCRCTLLQS